MNTRYLIGSHIIRQTWDLFHRDRDSMRGYRVQGKSLVDFNRRHPGFGIRPVDVRPTMAR